MKKLGKFFVGLSMAAIMALGLVACDPGDGSSSASGSNKPNSTNSTGGSTTAPQSTPPADTTPEDTGTLKDNVFEAEAAEYGGVSSNNGNNFGHACMSKSYVFDTSFSGNLSVRNVAPNSNGDGNNPSSQNNTITFKFNSDKAVKVKMEISVASRYDSGTAWTAMNFSQMYNTQVNGKYLTADVEVPAGNESQKVQNNNYTAMQLVELPVTLVKGENTITFTALAKACNLDYVNIKTSANLTGWTNHYWDESGASITVTKEPTLEATGTISFACEEGEASHAAQNWTMPKLNETDYEVNADKTVYSITVAGKKFSFEVEDESGTPDVPSVTYDADLNNDFTSDKANELKLVYGSDGVTTSGKLSEDEEVKGEGAIGYFDSKGATLSYTFSLAEAGKVDFVWSVAGSKWNNGTQSNDGLANMGANLTVTLDGKPVDVSGIALPAGDGTNTSAWWNLQKVVLKDVELTAGEHTLAAEVTAAGGLNVASMTVYSTAAFGGAAEVGGSTVLTDSQQQYPVMKADSWYKFGSNDKYTEADIMKDGKLMITAANPARMDLFKVDADGDATNENTTWVNFADKTDNFKDSGTAFYGYEYTYDMALSATGEFSLILFGTSALPAAFDGTSHRGIYLFFTDGTITVKQSGTGKDVVQATASYEGKIADITSVKLAIVRLSDTEILVQVYVNDTQMVFSGTPNAAKISAEGQYVDTIVTASNGYGQRFGVVPAGETVVTIAGCTVSKSNAPVNPKLSFNSATLTSVTLEVRDGKPCYVLRGTYSGFEADAFDVDFQLMSNWLYVQLDPVTTLNADGTFEMVVDLSGVEAGGGNMLSHFLVNGAINDVEFKGQADGTIASITVDGKVYTARYESATTWNRPMVLFTVTAAA